MLADKLRKSVLQSAIQGKLTEQLATDDKVEDLLQAIKEEKELLIKEKKIKKQKPLPEITEDEIPFAIPENWKWVRLGEVIELISGRDLVKDKYNNNCEGIPYITGASNFNNNNLIIDRWTNEATSIAIKNDILLTCKGTIGEIAVLKENKVHIARQIMSIRLLQGNIEYIKWYIISQIDKLKSMGKSIIPGISREMILNYLIPLPPLAEQKRIVEKLDNVLANIDELKANEEKLSILQKNFPDKLKKSILQSAIQGKLTEQLATDDNVEDLLQAIKEEKERLIKEKKIKKQKTLPEITEEEIPFTIPENWKWIRINDVSSIYTGNSINAKEKELKYSNVKQGYNYIATKDVDFNNCILYENGVKIPFETNFKIAKKGATLMCIEGGSAGRKVGFLKEDVCFGNKLCSFNPMKIYDRYIFYVVQAPLFINNFKINMTGIIGGVSINKLKMILIPLPPLAEQKRIVEKLDKLLADIEELKIE
ncbi:restriction endonuclease subunit S [Megamonas funiformis]|uniref:restriction endonuclease subunit S n=1 Tax=Megamonas funiformis TaxID=437897 RepID=UPI003F9840E9